MRHIPQSFALRPGSPISTSQLIGVHPSSCNYSMADKTTKTEMAGRVSKKGQFYDKRKRTNSMGVQVEDTRICVVMVGLPARGKSLIAQKGMPTSFNCILTTILMVCSSRPLSRLALHRRQNLQRRPIPTQRNPYPLGILLRHHQPRRRTPTPCRRRSRHNRHGALVRVGTRHGRNP